MFSNILKWNFCFNFEDEGRPKIITIFVSILSEATIESDYTAAGLDGEGGGDGSQDGDDELNDFRPSFFFHCRKVLKGVAALKIEAKIKDIISAELRTTERPVINGRYAQN